MQFSSIRPIDKTLSVAPPPGQSGPRSDGNERVLHITKISRISETSPSECSVSYAGHSLGWGSYPSAEMQSVYSTASADWATAIQCKPPVTTCTKKLQYKIIIYKKLSIFNYSYLMTNADYTDDLALLTNTPAQAESLLHSLEQAARGIGLKL